MAISISSRNKRLSSRYMGLFLISPWLIGFLIFQLYPFISSFIYSFTDIKLAPEYNFVGLKNYIRMFTEDPDFYSSLKITFLFVLVAVPAKLVFALLIALIMNMRLKLINLFRTIYYLPSILGGSVAIAVLWRFLFMREGTVNKILGIFGAPPTDWLGNPDISIFTLSLLSVWQFGSSMVIFLAGLKQIPSYMYEASTIDGASKARQFLHITTPMLTPIILFNLVMQVINAFQEFTSAFVITRGGPMKSTYLYTLMLYDQGFGNYRIGYASALSWILFIIIMVFTIIIFKTSDRWTYYEDGR
jgi:oligogalacturonide transport system permease protein